MMHGTSVSPAPASQRIWYLDFLKLLAAFLVVFYHLAYYELDYGFQAGQPYLPNGNRILMSFAACSVPLFFTVNGALLFRRHRTWKEMLLKAAKILALTLIWQIAQFPDWFFKTLIILYVIFPALQFLKERCPLLLKLLCCAVFLMPFVYNMVLMCLKGAALYGVIPDWTHGMTATGCFTMYSVLYFCLGLYLEEAKTWKGYQSLLCIFAGWALVIAECVIFTNSYQKMWDAVNAAFPTAGALLMVLGLFMGSRLISFAGAARFLKWAGPGILAVYLLHMWFIKLVKQLLPLESYGLGLSVLLTIAVFLLCTLVQKLFKKLHPLDWLLRI